MEALGNIAKVAAPAVTAGTGIAGLVGNAKANQVNNQALVQQLALQNKYANMTPDQFAQVISSFQKPLSQGLTQGVGNLVQANMAERGLAQSPGVFSEVMAQSLAPFQLQEQQMAGQQALQSLGLPIEAAARFLPPEKTVNTSSIWQQLLKMLGGSGGQQPNQQQQLTALTNNARNAGQGMDPSTIMDTYGTLTPPDNNQTGGTDNFNFMDFLNNMQPAAA